MSSFGFARGRHPLEESARASLAPFYKALNAVNAKEAPELIKQSTANPLAVSREIHKLLPAIEKSLPQGMKLAVVEMGEAEHMVRASGYLRTLDDFRAGHRSVLLDVLVDLF